MDFPGWTVTVDGDEHDVWTVDQLFRGVALESGTHEVVFRYRPRSFTLGIAIAGLGLVLCGALSWRGARP